MIQSNPADARDWAPVVADGAAPLYQRLADALHADIRDGTLAAGTRLPTQRALADSLGISVGTANSAYLEAERRGLVRRHVGRGTFVASRGTRETAGSGRINLAMNLPPFHRAAPLIRGLLAQLIDDVDTADLLGYPSFGETSRYAAAVSNWIGRTSGMGAVAPSAIVPCQGATQGLLAVLEVLAARGDAVLCERITYGGFKVAARQQGLRMVPVDIDAEGLVPGALEDAARESGARALIACPSFQNPTGAVAPLARRRALVRVARALDLWIVEDDVYGSFLADHAKAPPIATLAPERTFHVSSASKSLAPGLRAGWVVPPAAHLDALAEVLNARTASTAPFGCPMLTAGAAPFGFLAFAKLVETRMADQIAGMIREDIAERQEVARRILGSWMDPGANGPSLHAWLPLDPLHAETLHQSLALQEIHVTPPGSPMVADPPAGLRICLGGPERVQDLEQALCVVAGELARIRVSPQGWRP